MSDSHPAEIGVRFHAKARKAAEAAVKEILADADDKVLACIGRLDHYDEHEDFVSRLARDTLRLREQMRKEGKLSKRGKA